MCDKLFVIILIGIPQTCRHFSSCGLTLPLELLGTELIEVLVASNAIVVTLDVIEDFRFGLSPCWVNPLLNLLALQVTEERLSHRIIPAVAPMAHARAQSVVFAPTVEFIATKLATLIRMDDH